MDYTRRITRRIHPLSLKRRASHHARSTAKHDMAAALERLTRADGAHPAYISEVRRWLALLGYRLDDGEDE